MKAFGSKRHHGACIVYQAGNGKKILFIVLVKSRKHGRRWKDSE